MVDHDSYRRLRRCIPNGIVTELSHNDLDAVCLFDVLVECLSSSQVTLFCANDYKCRDEVCKNAVIYAGASAPQLEKNPTQTGDDIPPLSDWDEFKASDTSDQLHDSSLRVRYLVNSSGMFREHPSISFTFMSKAFHGRKVKQGDIDVSIHAFGKKGSYINRQGSIGFNAYPNSVRNDLVATSVSPNCGPGHLSKCTYHLQKGCDVRYMPAVHALTSTLNEAIYTTTKSLYRHIRCTVEQTRSGRINDHEFHSILTIDFANQPHVDKYDNAITSGKAMQLELDTVVNHPLLANSRSSREAELLRTMVAEFQNPLPTTCCYQEVRRDWRDKREISIHGYFPLPSIGVVLRLHHMCTHIFLGSVISHCTCPPVFVETYGTSLRVRIGSHPDHSLVAWGGKNKDKDSDTDQ